MKCLECNESDFEIRKMWVEKYRGTWLPTFVCKKCGLNQFQAIDRESSKEILSRFNTRTIETVSLSETNVRE